MDLSITDNARNWIRTKGGAAAVDLLACST